MSFSCRAITSCARNPKRANSVAPAGIVKALVTAMRAPADQVALPPSVPPPPVARLVAGTESS